jgi:hypothetical protein
MSLGGSGATQTLGARVNSRFMLGPNNEYMELVPRTLRRVEGPMVGMMANPTGIVRGAPGVVERNMTTQYYLVAYDQNGFPQAYMGVAFPQNSFIARASGTTTPPPCVASLQARSARRA